MITQLKSQQSSIGLHVDHHEFRALQLVRENGEERVSAWAIFPRLQPDQVDTDTPRGLPERDELRWACSILSRRGFQGRAITCAPPSRVCTQHVFELPPADSGAPLEVLARAEVARERRCDPKDFEIGFWGLPQRGRTSETMAVACSSQMIEGIIHSAETADLEVAGIDLAEIAILRGVQEHLSQVNADGDTPINSILHVGWEHSLAIVTLGARLVYVRRIPHGAGDAWGLATERYNLSVNSARAIIGDYTLKQFDEQLKRIQTSCWSSLSKQLASELDVAFAYVSHSFRMAPLGRVELSGYGATNATLVTQIDDVLGLPVRNGSPKVLIDAIPEQDSESLAARLAFAYGLASRFDA